MRYLLGKLGLGRILYRFYHVPADRVRDSLRAGGPLQVRRTERGQREMERAAFALPPPEVVDQGRPLNPHLLTGRRFWYQTAFCLHTLSSQSGRAVHPVIYDDGSLTPETTDALRRLFPESRFVGAAESVARLDSFLPRARFPTLRERWDNYPNIRKLIDPHLNSQGWKLVIDSDLLFFRRPVFLMDWCDAPREPLHAVDVTTSYGYSRKLLDGMAGASLAELVNVGLCGLDSAALDWPRIEDWCRTLIEREGKSYFLEQALVAMIVAGRRCSVAPASDYVTLPRLPEAQECTAVMHHYVADSKRWYFQHNWRRAFPASR